MDSFCAIALAAAGVAATPEPVQRPAQLAPFVLPWDDASAGATDLSFLLDAPAGKAGPIGVGQDGHLVDGNGERIRLFGVNFSGHACFPTREEADATVGRLAKFGVNAARFHHMDADWAHHNIFGEKAPTTRSLDPERLERLDYFIAQLKARGIYTNLNLLVGRPFKAADGLPPEIESVGWKFRHIVAMFDPRLIELQEEYARQLLTHRNPHTGLTYAEDPAIAFVEIINENGLVHSWHHDRIDDLPAPFLDVLRQQWNAFLSERAAAGEPVPDGWTAGEAPIPLKSEQKSLTTDQQRAWMAFLRGTEERYFLRLRDFIKNELGSKALVIGTITGSGPATVMAQMDVIDGHKYWQPPRYLDQPERWDRWNVQPLSMVNAMPSRLGLLAAKPVVGKPFLVTEYLHPAPNPFASEGPLLLAAFASLQDWDGVFLYNYAHESEQITGGYFFRWHEIAGHPTVMANAAIASLFFQRGDIRPAENLVTRPLSVAAEIEQLADTGAWYLVDLIKLGVDMKTSLLHETRIEIVEDASRKAKTPAVKLPSDGVFVSDTGQVRWDMSDPKRGVVSIDTPKTKGVIGYGEGREFSLGPVRIAPGDTANGWSTLILSLIDGDAFDANPKRALLVATAWAENTGMKWNEDFTSVGRDWGGPPSLVEVIPATLTLPLADGKAPQVFALDARGQRMGEPLPVETANGSATVTIGPPAATLWYEIVWQDAGSSESAAATGVGTP